MFTSASDRTIDRVTSSGTQGHDVDLASWRHGLAAFGVDDVRPLTVDCPRIGPIWLLSVDDSRFDPSMFAQAGIARPSAMVRSVLRRQAEFFYGRMAARTALRRLGVHASEVPIGPHREPIWPAGVAGSITHCHGLAAAAVVRLADCPTIGIDVERFATSSALEALRKTVLDRDEFDRLSTIATAMTPAMIATLAFSAKESFFKAAFATVGRFFGFEEAKIVGVHPGGKRLTLRLANDLAPSLPRGCELGVAFDWFGSDAVVTATAGLRDID